MAETITSLLHNECTKIGHYVGEFTTPGIGYIVKQAGADFVFFDLEHAGHSFETLHRCLRYFEAAGLPAIARVPSGQSHHVARALDAGAEAIVVPMVGSAEQARAIVEAMKFTPHGKRGLAPGLANDRYQMGPVREALDNANARTRFIALIETVDGIANVDQIAAVDGVDILWVGHLDLTASMGIPGQFDHPDFVAALNKVALAGKREGKALGRLVSDTQSGIELANQGWNWICYQGDAWLLQMAIRDGIDTIRKSIR